MSRKQKKRALSILLMISMIVSSISTKPIPAYASSVDGSHIHYSSDELVAEFNFGTDVTKDTVYSPDLGYGFTTVKYPDPAPGWVGGVYYPREQAVSYSSDYVNPVIDETDASENIIPGSGSDKDDNGDTVSGSAVNVTTASGPAVHVVTEPAPTDTNVNTVTGPAIGVLEIGSVVWTETESSGYGVYTYENTSVFNVDLENADYNVTVTLVNPTDTEYSAYLKAEDITKDSGITVAPGATVERTITAILIDGQLNLKFLATSSATQENLATRGNVYVSKVSIVRQATNEVTDKPTIFLASDSTVQTYDDYYYPQTGWGQTLYHFFGEFIEERECTDCDYSQAQTYETNNVVIENRAIGGRSSKSFIIEGKLDDLLEDVKPGDYVLVQWGHNDATYSRPNRYVSVAEFPEMLKYYIDGARQRGATPILITPVARYSPRADGTFNSDFEGYRQAMITLGGEMNVPVLDLTAASLALCEALGVEGAKSLFLHLAAGDYEGAYAGGATDSTHLQYYGAYKFAQCVAKLILDYSVDNQLDTLKSYVELKMPTTLPEAVSNLVTTTIGATSISFSWDAGDGSELYYIYRAELTAGMTIDDIDFTTAEKYSVSPVARYTDKNCESGKVYVYAVRGFNEFGLGELSDKILVSTKSALYKFDFDNSATDPVMEGWTQVTASQMYDEGLGYGWIVAPNNGRYRGNNGNADSSDMADDFCLGYGEFALDLPNGDYEVKIYAGDLLPGTSTIKASYSAEGASIGGISARQSIGTTVSVVRVVDGQLNVTVEGSNPYINGMEITPLLLAPSNLSYSEFEFKGTNAEFLINFDGISEAVEYRIYQKSTTDTQYSLVKVIAAADKDNLDSRAMVARIGETREYYVVAVLADGTETAPSLPIIIEMVDPNAPKPAEPTNLRCVSASKANIHIEWDAVDGAIYYNIYRSDKAEGTKGFNGFVKVGESSVASFIDTDNDVIPNIHYYYKVEAVGIGGIGPKSIALITPITEALVRTKAENLTDRALVAVDLAGDKGAEVNVTTKDAEGNELTSGVFLSWRLFEDDPEDVTFTVYKNGQVIASDLTVTNCVDPSGTAADTYMVVGSSDADLGLSGLATATWQNYYLELQLQKPEDQILPDGTISTYTANDMSVGDLDNDGQYELIVKWYPSASKDNAHSGYTGTTILDAYDIDTATGEATLMWRIDLGVNIRSGAHYTQFQVWDFDGDGRAEIVCKTADGTTTYQNINGTLVETGYVGACSASSLPTDTISSVNDYRNSSGYVLDGPEYLTIFDGETGAIIDTTDYIPARGNVAAWGDAYGNRVDRFLSAVAYLDGQKASAVFARGYYTRSCITAYDFIDTDDDGRGDKLVVRWAFDTNDYPVSEYGVTEGQGNHNIAINDVDNDGKDEIIYGAMVVDHDGSLKYVTGLGHGDAMHISDWIPSRPGLEIFSVHENGGVAYQVEVHDAETGEIIWGYHTGQDTGRGVAADIDPTHEGAEFWASVSWDGTNGGIYSSKSTLDNFIQLSQRTPSVNFTLFWDGDLLSELQDHSFNEAAYVPISTNITKWNYMTQTSETLFESTEVHTSNGTKGNVGLVADIIGDWREEIIARSSADDSKVRIYTTTIITDYTIPCLMENSAYRIGIAWQNVGYNQPANLDYLISEGLETSTLKAGDIKVNSATIIFTEASDGKYGHEVAGYEVYRATEGGEYVLIDTLSLDDLIEVTLDGEPIAEPVEYKFDFGASVLQDGWIQIDSSSPSYETNGTYGFTNETLALGLTEKAYGFDTANELYAMYTDCLLGWNASSPFEFVVNVPNGTYEVTFYTFNGSGDQYNQITIEDIKMDDIRRGRNDNGPTERSAIIEVTDGTVNVINQSSKSNGFAIYFSGLTIKQIVEETEPDIDTKIYYGYTDDTVDSDTTYSYSIAAIVNGRRSFMSNPVTIKTLVSISEILDFQLPDIVEGTPLPEGGSLADLLPAFLDVIDNNGNNTIADVIWDVSELDITTPGNYSVKGIIPGYTKILEKTVTVVPNEIILYEFEGYARVGDEEPYYTKNTVLNTIDLDLPETVIFKYLNGTTEEVAVIWDTSEIDITNKGSYLAVGTTAPLASSGGKFGEQTVKMKVEVKDDFISEFDNLPRIEGVIGSTVEEFIAGLPATLRAIYKSGNIQDVPVKWNTDNITDELLASEQVFNITGTVGNYSGTITLPVYVDYKVVWRFDFGISTDDVEEGWTGVTVNGKGGGKTLEELGSVYTPEKGYGFADGTAITEGRHEGYTFEGPLPPLVYRDFVLPDGQTFLVDVPNGTYIVEYSSGSYYRSKVSLVIEDTYSSSTSNGEQTYNIGKVVDVIITDGQMNIFFPTGNTSRLNAIIIRQVSVDDVEDPTPTPIPEDPTPTPIPEDPTPTPIPEDPTPTPIPEDPTPTPIPEDPTPTPIPEDPTPTPIPEDPTPTPIPEDPTPTPIPEDPTPTPIPEDPTPTPIPEDPTPTPVPEDPTPIPTATPTPTPTPTPVVVDEVTVDGLDGKIRYSILDGVEDGRINIITELPLDQILKTASEKDTEEALNVTVPISSQQIVGLMKQDEAKDVNVILKLSKDVLEHEDLQLNIQLDRILLQTSKDENKNITVSVVDEYNKERYSWTFTGDNLSKSNNDITDINLSLEVASVTSDTDIWELLEEKHRGENGLVLNFGHSGQLPAQASVRIYVGDREGFKPGDRIYLYHYNKSNGLLETLPYSSNYVIDKDGYITVDLVHCSDYVVLPKEADSSIILPLREQIVVSPKEDVIYLGGTVDNTTKIDVTLPVTLEQVENIGDPTSSSAIGAVTVKFTSSNEKVATVDRDGNIIAQGTGIAVIRTKITLYSGKTKTFNTIIYVRKPYIKITQSTETMKVGDRFTFEAKGYGVAEEDIQWLTTKKSIVVIGKSSGKATAESKGTDYVVAKAGDLTKQIKVVVK